MTRDWPINESVIDLHTSFLSRYADCLPPRSHHDRAALLREIQCTLNWPVAPDLIDDAVGCAPCNPPDAAGCAPCNPPDKIASDASTAPCGLIRCAESRASCVVLLTTLPLWTETRVHQLYETAHRGGFTHIQCRRWDHQDPFSLDRSIVLLRRADCVPPIAADSTRSTFVMWFEKIMLRIAQTDMHGWRRLLERSEAERPRACAATQSTPSSSALSWRSLEECEDPSICSD